MTRKLNSVVILLLVSFLAWAQAPYPSTPAIEARVDAMLKQLSLEEKIDLIGGVDDFYIRGIKHIGLPALKMADGPFGVRNYGPSTTFGGLGLAASWEPALAERMGAVIHQPPHLGRPSQLDRGSNQSVGVLIRQLGGNRFNWRKIAISLIGVGRPNSQLVKSPVYSS